MNLHNLKKTTETSKKRVGRGHGSGRVKTSGRGTKGQNARGTMKLTFEGGQLAIIKRLPFLKGKNRNNPITKKSFILNLKYLDLLPKNTEVDLASVIKFGLIADQKNPNLKIKILGEGEITKPLIVKLVCSKNARAKIEKAGGKVVNE